MRPKQATTPVGGYSNAPPRLAVKLRARNWYSLENIPKGKISRKWKYSETGLSGDRGPTGRPTGTLVVAAAHSSALRQN
jgi:hypothetical protein